DNETVAKAVFEKDRFIARLLQEKKEVEEALNKRLNEEEFLTKLEQLSQRPAAGGEAVPPQTNGADATAFDEKKISEIVAAQVAAREAESRKAANLSAVEQKLLETFGQDYQARVRSQAKVLGVGTEFLSSVAADNPAAFYRL